MPRRPRRLPRKPSPRRLSDARGRRRMTRREPGNVRREPRSRRRKRKPARPPRVRLTRTPPPPRLRPLTRHASAPRWPGRRLTRSVRLRNRPKSTWRSRSRKPPPPPSSAANERCDSWKLPRPPSAPCWRWSGRMPSRGSARRWLARTPPPRGSSKLKRRLKPNASPRKPPSRRRRIRRRRFSRGNAPPRRRNARRGKKPRLTARSARTRLRWTARGWLRSERSPPWTSSTPPSKKPPKTPTANDSSRKTPRGKRLRLSASPSERSFAGSTS
mmetsp:Transcript_11055/g.51185  ORF Transcript_11055/g.51185 Transcript_11055/m.51185 type:complete len:272 (-) Transcript_11055:2395-3210(-)